MRTINTKEIEKAVYDLAREVCINLTPSCLKALKIAEENETNEMAKFALETNLKNAEVAYNYQLPFCQDTGMSVVLLEIGQQVVLEGELLSDVINSAIKRSYADGFFRKSICDPLTRVNTTDNTPAYIHTEVVKGDKVKITFLPKGFGSENMSKIYMLTPAEGINGIIKAIVNTVKVAGSKPCPPVYVGVGIGSNFDGSAFLAKKALTREVGSFNERKDVAEIEKEALKQINELNIGAQGFGGKTTALGVSCEIAPTHIAGLPVAVNIQCHAVRCASKII